VVLPNEHPSRLILVLGGARSGKSTLAERLAAHYAATAGHVTYLATSETNDPEMAARVAAHRAARIAAWTTVECPLDVADAVRAAAPAGSVFLLECVTFWVSNLLLATGELGGTVPEGLGNYTKDLIPREVEDSVAARVSAAVADLLAALRETGATLIAVSNEVGLGIVPDYPIARLYRDELGRANRRLAEAADQVFLLVAGMPLELKSLAADPFAPVPSPPAAAPAISPASPEAPASPWASPGDEEEEPR
jgi:adenosylcobinamide kinase / adenosylcobinamide-phosphate guanylyltransferase